jgi:hypothetical protein
LSEPDVILICFRLTSSYPNIIHNLRNVTGWASFKVLITG